MKKIMKDVEREKILTAIAPCSLCCYTCPAMKGGVIEETSAKLHHYKEGYYDFCKNVLPGEMKAKAEKIKTKNLWRKIMTKIYNIEVDCANCANKMEEAANKTEGVKSATVNFMALKMRVEFEEGVDEKTVMKAVIKNCRKVEDDCEIYI